MTDRRDRDRLATADLTPVPPSELTPVPLPRPLYRERHRMPRAQTWRMFLYWLGAHTFALSLGAVVAAVKGPQTWHHVRPTLFGFGATLLLMVPLGARFW